jgi:hypothetical protein
LFVTSLSALLNSDAFFSLSYLLFPETEKREKKIRGQREKESGKIELETSLTMATEEAKIVEESPSEKRSEEAEGEVSVELLAPSGWKKKV